MHNIGKYELTNLKYAELKNFIYESYLYDLEHQGENKVEECKMFIHNKFNSKQLDNIFENTILFPLDLELYDFLLGKRLSPDNLELIMNKFDISSELLVAKIKEYVMYPIGNQKIRKAIELESVKKLSELYIKQKEEKIIKSVDF